MQVKSREKSSAKRGDTLIEVAIALAIFSLITLITIISMNRSAQIMQSTLELTMTRNEIDAQAEALRYIQNSYLSERELVKSGGSSTLWREYQNIWNSLTSANKLSNNPLKISAFNSGSCSTYYDTSNSIADKNHNIKADKAFILNTRKLDPGNTGSTIAASNDAASTVTFAETSLYPRVIFTRSGGGTSEDSLEEVASSVYDVVARAEGIWVVATRDVTGVPATLLSTISDEDLDKYRAEFFDFYIRGCWHAPGNDTISTISTVIRLYNPEYIEED